MKLKLSSIKWNHYINYVVIDLLTIVLSAVTLAGGRLDSSLLFLLEKIDARPIDQTAEDRNQHHPCRIPFSGCRLPR